MNEYTTRLVQHIRILYDLLVNDTLNMVMQAVYSIITLYRIFRIGCFGKAIDAKSAKWLLQ